ncbi:MAG: DUF2189 domain-containing protein [Alphaproteobacteria bacterium]|nr:DUF2189 domain-containing protein [Alphaproteobacteria bacterium]
MSDTEKTTQAETEVWRVRLPDVRRVPSDAPWVWLNQGWHDYQKSWRFGVVFGGFYALVGLAIVGLIFFANVHYLGFPLAAGFLLIGPITAVGMYEISRRLEADEPLDQHAVFFAFMRHGGLQIAMLGLVLVLLMIFWMKAAALIFALFFGLQEFSFVDLFDTVLGSEIALPFLLVGNITGAILAALAFSISVVSIPMLLDKDADFATAILTSMKVVSENPLTMLIWGIIIAGTMALSVVTAFTALVVLLPVIGHASWHAYRACVDIDNG